MRRTPFNRLSDFDNYHNSRWEFTKQRSRWHFDPQLETQDFLRVCQFTGDWDFSVEQLTQRSEETHWATRNNYRFGPTDKKPPVFSGRAEQLDLLNAGANPFQPIFDHCVADDQPIFVAMREHLGLTDCEMRFKNQRTGHVFHLHIDNFAHRRERGNSFKVIKADREPDSMARCLVMLADWRLGQFMQFGTQNFTHWRRGDVVTWDWQDIPYAWCNTGWEPCPVLQITGLVTDRFRTIQDSDFQVVPVQAK